MVFDSKTGLTAPIRRILFAQLVLIGVVTAGLLFAVNLQAAYSLLLGGALCLLANVIVAYGIFPRVGRRGSLRILKRFFVAEALKYLITVLAMIALFKWVPLNPLAFFVGYILAQTVFWFSPLLTKTASPAVVGAAL